MQRTLNISILFIVATHLNELQRGLLGPHLERGSQLPAKVLDVQVGRRLPQRPGEVGGRPPLALEIVPSDPVVSASAMVLPPRATAVSVPHLADIGNSTSWPAIYLIWFDEQL
jgi:hypothetical protein